MVSSARSTRMPLSVLLRGIFLFGGSVRCDRAKWPRDPESPRRTTLCPCHFCHRKGSPYLPVSWRQNISGRWGRGSPLFSMAILRRARVICRSSLIYSRCTNLLGPTRQPLDRGGRRFGKDERPWFVLRLHIAEGPRRTSALFAPHARCRNGRSRTGG